MYHEVETNGNVTNPLVQGKTDLHFAAFVNLKKTCFVKFETDEKSFLLGHFLPASI